MFYEFGSRPIVLNLCINPSQMAYCFGWASILQPQDPYTQIIAFIEHFQVLLLPLLFHMSCLLRFLYHLNPKTEKQMCTFTFDDLATFRFWYSTYGILVVVVTMALLQIGVHLEIIAQSSMTSIIWPDFSIKLYINLNFIAIL